MSDAQFSDLCGHELKCIWHVADMDGEGNEAVFFETTTDVFAMSHPQDCCEYVRVVDSGGDPADLRGQTIAMAEESTSEGEGESATWTFYRLATTGGDLCIRWLGESNGYYSEDVEFFRVDAVPGGATEWQEVSP